MPKESKEARKERQAREEWLFADALLRAGNQVEPEWKFPNREHPAYPFRVDYLINNEIAVEIQGFGFGHVGRKGWLRDIRKAQAIAAHGWLFIPVTREQVASGDALEALHRCGVKVESGVRSALLKFTEGK